MVSFQDARRSPVPDRSVFARMLLGMDNPAMVPTGAEDAAMFPEPAYDTDPQRQAKFLAQRNMRGISDLLFGGPDLVNTVLNAGLRDVGHWSGFDVPQLPMASQAAADLAAETTGQEIIPAETMPPQVQQQGANQQALIGAIPTSPGDAAEGALKAIFAGPLARTANKAMLETAEKMAAEGADRRSIWDATGWFQGTDKKWRFEIPDQASDIAEETGLKLMRNTGQTETTLGPSQQMNLFGEPTREHGLFDHDKLFEAYPDVADTPVKGDLNYRGTRGGAYYSAPGERIDLTGGKLDDIRNVGLHEAQHNVQAREGFARGGSPTDPSLQLSARVVQHRAKEKFDALDEERAQWVRQQLDLQDGEPSTGNTALAFRDLSAQWKKDNPEKAQLLDSYWNAGHGGSAGPASGYHHLAGEVEARNVQARRDMSDEGRRAVAPWESQDVPDDLQIVRYRHGEAGQLPQMSVEDPDWFPSITSPPGKDPDWFHPTGKVKLKDPFSSMTSETVPTGPMLPDKPISPEEMAKEGGFLMALYGDRTKAGQTLLGVNGQPLETPVKLGGGGRFMQENPGKIWASEKGRITRMGKMVQGLEERSGGKPVFGVHAAMGPKSGDFAKMTTRPLLDLAKTAPMSRKTVVAVDDAIREAGIRDWPGILKADEGWLDRAGEQRSDLAKVFQQAPIQNLPGVPSIAAIRKAITEDELMNAPLLTTGMSVGRFAPGGQVDYTPANPHDTYSTDILGQHAGNLGLLPFEAVFPNVMKGRPAAEQPRPGRQLLPATARTVELQGAVQEMNDEWLETIMPWWMRLNR